MWLGHLISCLSYVKSSGIVLTGISPNTSSAYEQKKTSTNLHHLPPEKKQERGKRGCIYIGPDFLSRFEIQTGTKGGHLKPGQKGPNDPGQKGPPVSERRGRTFSRGLRHGRD